MLISCRDALVGFFGLGVAVCAAAGGVFGAGCGIRVGWRTAGGGLVSVFQGFFANISKILDLAGGLGARLANGH